MQGGLWFLHTLPACPACVQGGSCAALTSASPGSGVPLRAFSVHTCRFISVYLRP